MTTTYSVLLVDDDPSMRRAMARVLESAGHDVGACRDGEEALAQLEARAWDVLVTDVRMPRLGGLELLERALASRPRLAVVVVTAYGTIEDAVRAVRRGASDYLLKPFPPATLARAVARAGAARAPAAAAPDAPDPIGSAPAFVHLIEQARRAAATDATILIHGESGTGKEVLARWIHRQSTRASGPFVAVNCAALPAQLLEAELFGVRRGAYTGADADREGRFARAHGGTLLLDEIGDCPLPVQAKLLRAIEERAVVPLGADAPRPVDLRIVAATHRDLAAAVARGEFRQDLYFRLRVIPLEVPPLRERMEDVERIARHMIEQISRALERTPPRLDRAARARLLGHHWPGNVRELRNVIERAVVMCRGDRIGSDDLLLDDWSSAGAGDALRPGMTIADAERRLIERTLEAAGGNRTHASRMLGISVRTLRNKLRAWREEGSSARVSAP